jgi:hypothetical protein
MQRLEISGAVRHIYIYTCVCVSLGGKGLIYNKLRVTAKN